MDIGILVGGAAGQGMDTILHIVGLALTRSGYHCVTAKDYMSRVRGGHNFSRLRVSDTKLWSVGSRTDILVALNEETYHVHAPALTPQGQIIYDPALFQLPDIETRGVPVGLKELAQAAGHPIMANMVAVGALSMLLEMPVEPLEQIVRETFVDKPEVVDGNLQALAAGRTAAGAYADNGIALPTGRDQDLIYVDGNQVLGMSALGSGCRYLSAYPMTPATGIMTYLAGKMGEFPVVVEQAEDEIAAINMALGASYAGVRAMTVTSGGGFALMAEGLSLAGMVEQPVVIVLGMRPGPATGLPTRTEQGDLDFAIHAGHGEFPRAVLSATHPADAFYRLSKAFELADRFQTPIIFLSDQNFADQGSSIIPFDFARLECNRHLVAAEDVEKPYLRYRHTASGISPRLLPGQIPGEIVLVDSDEHDEKGNIIEDAGTRLAMMNKRLRKNALLAEAMDEPEYYGHQDAEILLLGWGSTYGVLREAMDSLQAEGLSVAMLHFADLWPLPCTRLKAVLPRVKVSFCVENNATGQLAGLIRRAAGLSIDHSILKYDGRPFSAPEICQEVKSHVL